MTRIYLLSIIIGIHCCSTFSQDTYQIKGIVADELSKKPLENISVILGNDASQNEVFTRTDGLFEFSGVSNGDYILYITDNNYLSQKFPVKVTRELSDLGVIYLKRDITVGDKINLITLSDNELSDDIEIESPTPLLQATRDIFLTRAAFDFSQAFFKVKGYDSKYGVVFINGVPMNKMLTGRPEWNNWGGLNDATRNQDLVNGLSPSEYGFGGLLGSVNISTRASEYRKGIRISSSLSNRTYTGRVMATYNSGLLKNGLAYSVSASRRWAKQGYIEGTFYDAYSFFGAIEYKFGKHSINATAIYSPNRRGQSSAITQEVFDLSGRKYNPYWGIQDGKIRNSRVKEIKEPIAMLSYFFENTKFSLTTGIAYQFGKYSRSRLGYYNAPNPEPTYYRYLPSYYINSSGAANFENANLAKETFLANPQLDWQSVYNANTGPLNNGKSVYVLYDDRTDDRQLSVSSTATYNIGSLIKLDAGINYKKLTSANYAILNDLLGGNYHEDIDTFTNTRNDLNSETEKKEGDKFNYNYFINASKGEAFLQLKLSKNKWETFVAGNITNTTYQREGKFLNERYQQNSLGKSEKTGFSDFGIKGGFNYKISGRHFVDVNGAYLSKAPVIQNTFINPRENKEIVKNIASEKVTTGNISYILKLPRIDARLTTYYTKFQNGTDVNFFFVQGGIGTDFVQEVVTNINKLHLGSELGMVYKASPTVKLSVVASYGNFKYDDDAEVSVNFDTSGEEPINTEGFLNLGTASVKGYKIPAGPQKAFSLGFEYRDPDYWWLSATANYLGDNYISISTINRTQSFTIDPDSEEGTTFPEATPEALKSLLKQEKLEGVYLLNLVGGKSWIIKGKYISLFGSVNNLFDVTYRTGGYEQSRNGNFGRLTKDLSRNNPSFGPKYWYGYGRTYFLNLSVSF
ncbi:TonB-dependent receptor [Abyssalbus ytuae]|uniref:TonB-dependent receptor n=1 Tax=Abyssalbus ytuae TaxID=2926907 RepID=A0A9E6ZRG0_9FLAO|nr:TonB-dependent receptor [Abyssalbus ytuae]UOB19130.1 TonB-dependent receptor [Abyssalbus ytuae]